ncbi:hypothetical protein ACJX0J_017659, partial [Zea mays]
MIAPKVILPLFVFLWAHSNGQAHLRFSIQMGFFAFPFSIFVKVADGDMKSLK